MRKDALFAQELLCFVPVLLWSRPSSRILFENAKGSFGQMALLSMVCALLTQEISAIPLFPLAFVSRGVGGTQEALELLAALPGPGILWGMGAAFLLFKSERRA